MSTSPDVSHQRAGEPSRPRYVCPYDGEAFDQKSRFERHMASAHPPRAPCAADIEKALAGIEFPKSKRELVEYAAQRVPADSDVMRAIRSLPDGTYRDAAEVAVGFGQARGPGDGAPAEREPPSVRGGHAAATEGVSAAAVAKILGGIDFPKTKSELVDHARHRQESVGWASPRSR